FSKLVVIPRDDADRVDDDPAPIATAGGGVVDRRRLHAGAAMTAVVIRTHLTPYLGQMRIGLFGRRVLEHTAASLDHDSLQLRELLVTIDDHGAAPLAPQVHDLLSATVEVDLAPPPAEPHRRQVDAVARPQGRDPHVPLLRHDLVDLRWRQRELAWERHSLPPLRASRAAKGYAALNSSMAFRCVSGSVAKLTDVRSTNEPYRRF